MRMFRIGDGTDQELRTLVASKCFRLAVAAGAARGAGIPMLMVYDNQTPLRSQAEMEAFGKIDTAQSVCLPEGKLSLHEEFAAEVADVVAPFLAAGS